MSNHPPTVLLGWELGGGFGHANNQLRLASALAARGCRPVLVLRDLTGPGPILRDCPFPILQGPLFTTPRVGPSSGFMARSYADILARIGFADADDLLMLVRGWLALLDLVRPDLVICDHSPTLCLAASGVVPTALIGNGFALPPADVQVFPPLAPEQPPLVEQERLLEVVRDVQRRLGRPLADTLPGTFRGTARFLTVLPELDAYRELRTEPWLGPFEPLPPPLPPPERASFFAYLSTEMPRWEAILTCLARTGVPGRAFVRNADAAGRQRLRALGLDVAERPVPLASELATCAVVVGQGGIAFPSAALAAGRPQLLFPAHLEQLLNARRLHGLGVAHFLTGQFPAAEVGEGLRQLLHEPRFLQRARAAAEAVHAAGPWNPLESIVARCLRLCEARSGSVHPSNPPTSLAPKECPA